MKPTIVFRAQRDPYFHDKIELRFVVRQPDGTICAPSVTITALPSDEENNLTSSEPIQPALVMDGNEARLLMDELWLAGVRPSEGMGSVGQLSAVQAHLEDMRRLVFERVMTENREVKNGI